MQKTGFFNAPKWIYYDSDEQLIFVSNEEEGSIVRMESSGRQYCIRNGFPISTGLSYEGGALWAAAGITIYKLDPITGITELSFRTPAQFLQGLTTDNDGILYSSDPYSGIIFKSDPGTGQTVNLCTGLDYPQSIKYDSELNRLIVLDGEFVTTIKLIDPASGEITKEVETEIIPGGDITPDLMGNHYISSPEEGIIYAATRNFQDPVFAFSEGNNSPVGLVYYPDDKSLGMISTALDSLFIIPATATGTEIIGSADIQDIRIFPNPVEEILHVKLPLLQKNGRCRMSDARGKVIRELSYSNVSQMEIAVGDLPRGIYFLIISGQGIYKVQKILVR